MNGQRMLARVLLFLLFSATQISSEAQVAKPAVKEASVYLLENPSPRIVYGAEKLTDALKSAGYTIKKDKRKYIGNRRVIYVGTFDDPWIKTFVNLGDTTVKNLRKEGFIIKTTKSYTIVGAGDNSGLLYGCLELANIIRTEGKLPASLNIVDQPEMVLRGACIGIQKPYYLPGRHVYEYPYTPETFPWLYDKKLWIQYLDSMVANRMNSLYLWNGHPFASLVKLKDYPFAVEVDDATFKKNEELYTFLTKEADKRGIWVIQMFYNIIVSKPFAEHYNIKTQDRNRPITPLIADYTRKSIAAFVEKYPNVGLLITLGEAMEGAGQDDVDWFTKTIIPGVQDGLKALGKTEEPPIVLRAHDTDAPRVMKDALPLYKNLYTMAKYNGEALTTYTPRGPWAELHQKLSSLGSVQIENVHILANLEPFRYGSPDFIQKCVLAMHNVYHSNGLHLYPESSYWDWPYTADKTTPRTLEMERDWIWYKAWARYAWNAHRNRQGEVKYWSDLLANKFGTNEKYGKEIVEAYEESGEIAPKLLRRFGITDGNRQTLTLGMLMTQLINPFRYGLFTLLYNSEAPEGEMLTEYAEKEFRGEKHIGETPVQIINEVKAHGKEAVEAIEKAAPFVTKDKEEFNRLKNDMHIYNALANSYAKKAEAALLVLRYKYSNDINDLKRALPHLQSSVDWFKKLTDLTKDTYLYANSMQTQQRKIPVGGNDATMKTWEELLPVYETELATFRHKIDSLESPNKSSAVKEKVALKNADVKILSGPYERYSVGTGAELFADTSTYIKDYADELKMLEAIKLNRVDQMQNGTEIKFQNDRPVKVLVGFFNIKDPKFTAPPELETDASANDRGQASAAIANAMLISGIPSVNVHTYSFPAGTNTLKLAKGTVLVLGFVDADKPFPNYDAGLTPGGVKRELDWLFE